MNSRTLIRTLQAFRQPSLRATITVPTRAFSTNNLFYAQQESRQPFKSQFSPQAPAQKMETEEKLDEKVPFEKVLASAQKEFVGKGIVCVGETKNEKGERQLIIFTNSDYDKEVPSEYQGYTMKQVEGAVGSMVF